MIVELNMSSILFFVLGFMTCAAILLVLAVFYVVFPHIREAKRFFNFWLKIRNKERKEVNNESK